MKNKKAIIILPKLALILLIGGAVGSLYFVLHAGRNNESILLVGLFAIWVLSPFLALIAANTVYRRSSFLTRRVLYALMLIITIGSLIGYTGALSPVGAKPAGVFLIVPFISWLLMAIVIPISRSRSMERFNN
jgi:hypothetical protein